MGLDMSLYRVTNEVKLPVYPEVIDRSDPASSQLEADYHKACDFVYEKGEDVAYWRKFNALHVWFVNECQDGIDQCQYAEVTEDKLEELSQLLADSLERKDVILEPQGGFFFGSTDVDEYYWENVKNTLDKICEVLTTTDFDMQKIIYNSSW